MQRRVMTPIIKMNPLKLFLLLLLCQTLCHMNGCSSQKRKRSVVPIDFSTVDDFVQTRLKELSENVTRINDNLMQLQLCPPPWLPFEDMCLIYHGEKKTWPDALHTCVLFGGSLLWLKNEAEHAIINCFLEGRMKRDDWYFLGLHRKTWGGPLEWTGPPNNTYYGNPFTHSQSEHVIFSSTPNNTNIDGDVIDSQTFSFVCRY